MWLPMRQPAYSPTAQTEETAAPDSEAPPAQEDCTEKVAYIVGLGGVFVSLAVIASLISASAPAN